MDNRSKKRIESLVDTFSTHDGWTTEALTAKIDAIASESGLKQEQVAQKLADEISLDLMGSKNRVGKEYYDLLTEMGAEMSPDLVAS